MRNDSRRAGFTIVELLVVLVVIAVLASIALVALINALDKARQRATMADMRTISKAIEGYQVDNSRPPDHNGGIATLTTVLTPYHSSVMPINDHWKGEYAYSSDGTDNYTIESYGKDGIDGADIDLASKGNFLLDIVLVNGAFSASPE